MTVDPVTAGILRNLARRVTVLDARVRSQARASQAAARSVEVGAQAVYDDADELRAVVGLLEDGAYGITTYGGTAMQAPSMPLIASVPGGVTITWDGYDALDELGWPLDFRRVLVFQSTVPYAENTDPVAVASIENPAGGAVTLALPPDVTTFVWFVAESTSGVRSAPSVETSATGGVAGQVVTNPADLLGITPGGDATLRDLSYTGTFQAAADTFLIDGEALAAWRNRQPRGVVAYGSRLPAVTGVSAEYGVLEVAIPAIPDASGRLYRVSTRVAATPQGTLTSPRLGVRVRQSTAAAGTTPAAPTAASTQISQFQHPMIARSVAHDFYASELIDLASATEYRLLLTFFSGGGATSFDTNGTWEMIVEDIGPVTGDSGVKNTGGGVLVTGGSDTGAVGVPTQTEQPPKTYNATVTKWWTGGGAFGGDGDSQYFGNSSSTTEGNRKSAIWFNKAAIAADLAGATVTKVELYLYLHKGGNNNSVAIGSHTDTSSGSNDYGDVTGANRQRQPTSGGWDQGSGRWVNITFDLQDWTVDAAGKVAGFVIGPATDNGDDHSAGYRGATHSLHPKLRITYKK
ncbi:MAG TPA: hypothetical protein VMZ71_12440 [Gemmataceae bacterium]|nr:hypothetical protein [Gemmataceae bacterium]